MHNNEKFLELKCACVKIYEMNPKDYKIWTPIKVKIDNIDPTEFEELKKKLKDLIP